MRKKRLIAVTNGELNNNNRHYQIQENKLLELKSLDSADIKSDRCPNCKYSPLEVQDGYKICPECNTVYKILKDSVYVVS